MDKPVNNQLGIVGQVLKASALTTLAIGLALILFPHAVLEWFDSSSSNNDHFAVYLGTALIGFSVTNWLYSRSQNLQFILPAIYGNITSLAIGSVIDLVGLWSDKLNEALWSILLLHIGFLAAFIYCAAAIRSQKEV